MIRIGMMLRAFDEKGGIGVYARNLVPELLKVDQKNHYTLFFNNPQHIGLFAQNENVKEVLIGGKHKAIWDQIAVPLACWRENIDIVFHPKFTLPLLAPCKTVMVVHGADWFMSDQSIYYTKLDIAYIRTFMPLYFRKANAVISVSQLTTDNFNQALSLPPGKIHTIYFAPANHFRKIDNRLELDRVKQKYNLPDRYILTLTKRLGDKRKNLPQIFKAYQNYHKSSSNPTKLVIGGKDCYLFNQEYNIPEDGFGKDIIYPGWIDQADLPAVYSMASIFLYPSNLEAFPIPLTEAMACGTPIITSNINGLKEIAGDAALFVDPQNPLEISSAIRNVIDELLLSSQLSQKGLERAALFTWETCAKKTLNLLENVAAS